MGKYHQEGLQISSKQRAAIEIISTPQKVVATILNASLNQTQLFVEKETTGSWFVALSLTTDGYFSFSCVGLRINIRTSGKIWSGPSTPLEVSMA